MFDLQECDAGGEEEDVIEAAERERGRRGDRGGGRRTHGRKEEQEEEEKGQGDQLIYKCERCRGKLTWIWSCKPACKLDMDTD